MPPRKWWEAVPCAYAAMMDARSSGPAAGKSCNRDITRSEIVWSSKLFACCALQLLIYMLRSAQVVPGKPFQHLKPLQPCKLEVQLRTGHPGQSSSCWKLAKPDWNIGSRVLGLSTKMKDFKLCQSTWHVSHALYITESRRQKMGNLKS